MVMRLTRQFGVALAVLMAATLSLRSSQPVHATDELDDLIAALGSDDLAARRDAAYDLAKIGPDAEPAVAALMVALKDGDEQVRFQSTMALARIGPAAEPAVPVLIELLTSRDDQRRYRAAFALGIIAGLAQLPGGRASLGPRRRRNSAEKNAELPAVEVTMEFTVAHNSGRKRHHCRRSPSSSCGCPQ